MSPQSVHAESLWQRRRRALVKARRLTSMLQGTMALEGQGLDKKALWALTKESARELLSLDR